MSLCRQVQLSVLGRGTGVVQDDPMADPPGDNYAPAKDLPSGARCPDSAERIDVDAEGANAPCAPLGIPQAYAPKVGAYTRSLFSST